jgi:hypothetical protein
MMEISKKDKCTSPVPEIKESISTTDEGAKIN